MHDKLMNRYLYKADIWNERKTKLIGFLFNVFPQLNIWMGKYIKEQLKSSYYMDLIEEYKPKMVFSTHPFVEEENQLLTNAQNCGINTISIVHSWDNLTGKGRMQTLPDQLIVWNRVMKSEAINLYPKRFTDKNVHVVGVPQHDYLINDDWKMEKESFFRKLGADPKKKVITYISRGGKYSHYREDENLDVLISGLKNEIFVNDCQLIVREVASHDRSMYKDVLGYHKGVVYDFPDVSYFPNSSSKYPWSSDVNATYHLGNLLYYSDVIINFGSTITLDSAYFNKPTIWSIYRTGSSSQHKSDRHIPDELSMSHLQPILKLDAVTIPNKPEDLIALVNDALEKPNALEEQRSTLRTLYCPFYDGKAGHRIANIIINNVES